MVGEDGWITGFPFFLIFSFGYGGYGSEGGGIGFVFACLGGD